MSDSADQNIFSDDANIDSAKIKFEYIFINLSNALGKIFSLGDNKTMSMKTLDLITTLHPVIENIIQISQNDLVTAESIIEFKDQINRLDSLSRDIEVESQRENIDADLFDSHVDEIYKLLKAIEYQLTILTKTRAELIDEVKNLKSNIIDLRHQLDNDKNRINQLDKELSERNQFIDELHRRIASVAGSRDLLESERGDLYKNINMINEENSILKAELVKRQIKKTNINFQKSSDKYANLENIYRLLFIISIFLFPTLSVSTILFKEKLISFIGLNYADTTTDYWSIKISIILIGITLISYFLKMSSHYQKLAEQNHQTHTELDALPDFIDDLAPEDIRDIKKELTPKYFGRDIDGSTHKDMSNLISDQTKNVTELIKASAEMAKNTNQVANKLSETTKSKDAQQ